MKLKKIFFDAFKSLLGIELEINNNCVGLVGINESGKSNLLYAINVLRGNRKLGTSDTPKMKDKNHNPSLRFEFEPTSEERNIIVKEIQNWSEQNTLVGSNIKKSNFNITYHIIYNNEEEKEERSFYLTGLELDNNYVVLLKDFFGDLYKIKHHDVFVALNQAIIIKESDIKINESHLKIYNNLETLNEDIKKLEDDIKNTDKNTEVVEEKEEIKEDKNKEADENNLEEGAVPSDDKRKLNKEINQKQKEIEKLNSKKDELETTIKDFNLPKLIRSIKDKIEINTTNIAELKLQLKPIKDKISELNKTAEPNEAQKKELTTESKKQSQLLEKIHSIEYDKKQKEKELEVLNKPLEEKYTTDVTELNNYLEKVIHETLNNLLPKVVFWEHDKEFILQSETLFKDILSINVLDDVSRPLVNVFRVGLEIQTIKDLHARIYEIQKDPNERSKVEKKLNTEVNNYIKSVWPEYDQDINITLENDRIRIEVYDPEYNDASYYNMEERSQGAQTFISFLLTIGAEAKQGVIKDTILLLDEPETHLHPSGVRFMLKELIKIANKSNIVIYATHSIFMIDRDNYNRHIILEKEKEQTTIKPSSKDRIGFFMQEEVLYSTLDIDLEKDFTSTKRYNFVFEGDGDAIIFEHFYSEILENPPFLLKNSSYYHGGGCKNIRKYLSHRPIQLGTKWIFILDKDEPANILKGFIESKYKDYINKDIFIFQYENKKKKSEELELEDILPSSFILDCYNKTSKQHDFEFKTKQIDKLMSKDKSFEEYNKKIIETLYAGRNANTFKEDFKKILNSEIKNKLTEVKDVDKFKDLFPDYFNWAASIISEI